jgi:hypothetical protein
MYFGATTIENLQWLARAGSPTRAHDLAQRIPKAARQRARTAIKFAVRGLPEPGETIRIEAGGHPSEMTRFLRERDRIRAARWSGRLVMEGFPGWDMTFARGVQTSGSNVA